MHIPSPSHDTRRGSSRYRTDPDYAAADAHEDRHERERALATLRARIVRDGRRRSGAPSAHQINAILADAVGLALHDPAHKVAMRDVFGPALRRAMAARGRSMRHEETRRLFDLRLRPSTRILDIEVHERVAAEVAARTKRGSPVPEETLALLKAFRDDEL